MTRFRLASMAVPCALLVLALAACQGRQKAPNDTVSAGEGNRPYYAGTPQQQQDIRKMLRQVPDMTGAARIELGRRIVNYGEPAIPILVEGLRDPDRDIRSASAWLLGFLGDPRTVGPLRCAVRDGDVLVRLDAAGSLTRMADPNGLPVLVRGLEASDARIRAQCILILQEYTGQTFGYRVDDTPQDRQAAVARWRAWVSTRTGIAR